MIEQSHHWSCSHENCEFIHRNLTHSLISENDRKRWLVNGHRIKLGHQDDRLTVFYFEDSVLNLDEASWLEAVDRIKVGTNLLSG